MELRHLRYFVVSAEAQNFNLAADRLHIAQPALSRQIKGLEEELGFALFERLPRGVRLTDRGEAFLVSARRTLAEAERTRLHAMRLAQGEEGTISVGFNVVAIANLAVAKAITQFRVTRPQVGLSLVNLDSPEQLDRLRQKEIDVALLYDFPENHSDIEFLKVADYTYVLALPLHHPLAAAPEIRLPQLKDDGFIWTQRQYMRTSLVDACNARGLTPHVVQETRDFPTQLNLISVGLGVGFVHPLLVEPYRDRVVVKQVDLDLPLPLYAATLKTGQSKASTYFVSLLRQISRDEGKPA